MRTAHHISFYVLVLNNNFYGVQYSVRYKVSAYKSIIVISDSYQVTSTVIRKKLFILSNKCLKCRPTVLTQARSRLRQWSIAIASSMTYCRRPDHAAIRRCFRSLRSNIGDWWATITFRAHLATKDRSKCKGEKGKGPALAIALLT